MSRRPTRPPPPVGVVLPPVTGAVGPVEPVGPVVPLGELGSGVWGLGTGRFGYAGVSQQALGSALGPVCGAWSNVMAIRPPSLYAADFLICGTPCRRKTSAVASPAGWLGAHGSSLPSWQRLGTMYANAG